MTTIFNQRATTRRYLIARSTKIEEGLYVACNAIRFAVDREKGLTIASSPQRGLTVSCVRDNDVSPKFPRNYDGQADG
jgi:hypothetical protein